MTAAELLNVAASAEDWHRCQYITHIPSWCECVFGGVDATVTAGFTDRED